MGQRVGAASLTTEQGAFDKKIRIAGEVYRLRCLTIGEYDALVEKHKVKRPNPISGVDEEVTDNTALLRSMVSKSTGISLAKLGDLPMPVQLTLNAVVNEMHFPPTDEGAKGALWEPVTDEDEEEGAEGKTGEG